MSATLNLNRRTAGQFPHRQPFAFETASKKAQATFNRSRWKGRPHKRYSDLPSAYPKDHHDEAEGLVRLLYSEPLGTKLDKLKNSGGWASEGLPCHYHQGALISGIPLNEKERLQRRKDLSKIRGQLEKMTKAGG